MIWIRITEQEVRLRVRITERRRLKNKHKKEETRIIRVIS